MCGSSTSYKNLKLIDDSLNVKILSQSAIGADGRLVFTIDMSVEVVHLGGGNHAVKGFSPATL